MLHLKKIVSKLLILVIAGTVLLMGPGTFNPASAAAANKDVILVLDTSLSMVGYQGRDIFDSVKVSINKYIDNLQDGDRVTFVTFDKGVKVMPQVLIDDQNDRDIIKKYISATEAKGEWTYTLEMLKTVFALAEKMTRESAQNDTELKRNVVIVIMSDGLDDPPPAKARDRFNLKKVAEQYSGNDWWIYLVNLEELQKSKKITDAQKKLLAELNKVSPNTSILDGTDPDKAINDALRKDVERRERAQFYKLLAVVSIVLILILIAVLLILKLRAIKIKGSLEFWSHELLKPDVHTVSLTAQMSKIISIGRVPGSTIVIRDYEWRNPFLLKAIRKEGKVLVKIEFPEGVEAGFKNKEDDGFLNDGDIFSVSNLSFRYIAE